MSLTTIHSHFFHWSMWHYIVASILPIRPTFIVFKQKLPCCHRLPLWASASCHVIIGRVLGTVLLTRRDTVASLLVSSNTISKWKLCCHDPNVLQQCHNISYQLGSTAAIQWEHSFWMKAALWFKLAQRLATALIHCGPVTPYGDIDLGRR